MMVIVNPLFLITCPCITFAGWNLHFGSLWLIKSPLKVIAHMESPIPAGLKENKGKHVIIKCFAGKIPLWLMKCLGCANLSVYLSIYLPIYLSIYLSIHAYIYIYLCIYMYIYIYISMHIYIYISMHIYIYAYIYLHVTSKITSSELRRHQVMRTEGIGEMAAVHWQAG